MRQLTSLDAQFLALESPRQTGHVGGLAIVDPSTRVDRTFDCAAIKSLLRERLPLLPPFRWKLTEVPFGLDYPYWVDDEEFDLEYHVREIALPAPGSDRQLADQVARIQSRPLDRARPLWEVYVIQGLESGNVAMLTKIHHAVIDGMSGAEIMGLLLDLSPEGRELPEAPDDGAGDAGGPSGLGMLARGLMGVPRYPVRALRSLPRAVPNIEETPFRVLPGAGTAARVTSARTGGGRRALPRSPRTRFSGRISPHRRFAFGKIPLDEVKAVKNAHGVTVNDVIVTICAGAVRRWLEEHHDLPDEPLVGQIPVSVRTSEQAGTY